MSFDRKKLLSLLPAYLRARDAELASHLPGLLDAGEQAELAALEVLGNPTPVQRQRMDDLQWKRAQGPLASLLAVLAEQVARVEEDLEQLQDDAFIETCADWVIPYIGDLIGYRGLHGQAPQATNARAEVAHTIAYRRRKGTASVLEQLARDVTGWESVGVEYFQRIITSQYTKHRRTWSHAAPDLRRWRAPRTGAAVVFENIPPNLDDLRRREPLDLIGGGFDTIPRTVEVRRIGSGGRHHIPNVGLFVWPWRALSLSGSPAVAVDGRRFRFHPLGIDHPLVTLPRTETDISSLATPLNVPMRINRRALHERRDDYCGHSFRLYVGTSEPLPEVPAAAICACNLSDDGATWAHLPATGIYAVDPVLGRIALPPGLPAGTRVRVDCHHASPADLGGGEYPRLLATPATPPLRVPQDQTTLQAALAALGGEGTIEITDSGRYEGNFDIAVAAGRRIEIRAANRCRPTLVLSTESRLSGGADSAITLDGLLIAGHRLRVPAIAGNQLRELSLRHCTLVPGRSLAPDGTPLFPGEGSVLVETDGLRLRAERCILGALRVDEACETRLEACILDATAPTRVAYAAADGVAAGGPLTLRACTSVGKLHVREFGLVSNSILWAERASGDPWVASVLADRRQLGCLRFSYVPADARTPKRFRCVPESSDSPVPALRFAARRYGAAGYLWLGPGTGASVRQGADDEGEMGVYHLVAAPHREANLRLRLDEYLRVGLEAGIFHET